MIELSEDAKTAARACQSVLEETDNGLRNLGRMIDGDRQTVQDVIVSILTTIDEIRFAEDTTTQQDDLQGVASQLAHVARSLLAACQRCHSIPFEQSAVIGHLNDFLRAAQRDLDSDLRVMRLERIEQEHARALAVQAERNPHKIGDPEVRRRVFDLTNGRCAYCDVSLGESFDGASFVVEHVVTGSHGGPDNLANYVPACSACNSSKSNRHVIDFVRRRIEIERASTSSASTVVPIRKAAGDDE